MLIVAVFSLEDEALFAVEALESAGVDRAQIGVLATRRAATSDGVEAGVGPVRDQLAAGGFAIWIRPSGSQQAEVARRLLTRHGATRVLESTRLHLNGWVGNA